MLCEPCHAVPSAREPRVGGWLISPYLAGPFKGERLMRESLIHATLISGVEIFWLVNDP